MTNGLELLKHNIFNTNSSEINNFGKKFIESFTEVLKFNRGAKFTVLIGKYGINIAKESEKIQNERLQSFTHAASAWSSFDKRFKIELNTKDEPFDFKIIVDEIKDPLK